MKKYLMEDPSIHNEKLAEALDESGIGFLKNLEILDALVARLLDNKDEATFVLTNGREINLSDLKKMRESNVDPRTSL